MTTEDVKEDQVACNIPNTSTTQATVKPIPVLTKAHLSSSSLTINNAASHTKKPHSRTQSITMHPVTQKNGSKKQHNRRGSLPNLNVANHHKLASVDFGSPLRSPFPPPLLPEKGSIAIQLGGDSHTVINTNKTILKNLSYIFTWYFFSTCLSLYNKNLMGRDRFNFNYPLLASAIHAMLHSIITACIMWFGGTQNGLANKKAMSLKDYFYKVVPCGMAAAIEICCSNASLVYITLSFYTMVKSSTPIWVLLFSFLFGFEKPRLLLITIIFVMVTGVVLTVEGETKFDPLGFTLVLTASVISGLRWSMTQLLLTSDKLNISSPIETLYYLSPIMFVTTFTLSLIYEKPFQQSQHFDTLTHIIESLGLMSIGGFLAFAMTLAELYLIKSTNTITLSVAGISKEIVIITLSVLIYGDVLTPKNLLGLFVSIVGIVAYNYYKLSKKQQAEKGQYQMIPLHSSSNRNLKD